MIKILIILLPISQLFGKNDSNTFKIKSTKDCGTLPYRMTAKSHNPELTYFIMGQLIIKSPKHGTHIALYDDEDHELISKHTWGLKKHGRTFYVRRVVSKSIIYFHRLILGFPKSEVDHINGNGLDNQRKNLRLATRSENCRNKKRQIDNTSGYKGVSWDKKLKKFRVRIQIEKKTIQLGLFNTAKEGGDAYNKAAKKYFGEFAKLNQL